MTNNGLYFNDSQPRLCHLRQWHDFTGYGFNLHSEKSKPGQYIGKVDQNSPAESAGLRENDRIIEVNYIPIGNENHKQVVQRIKEGVTRNGIKYPEEVILLVVDPATDEYYKRKCIVVHSSDANVEKIETKIRDETGSNSSHSSHSSTDRVDNSPVVPEPSPQMKLYKFDQDSVPANDFTTATETHAKSDDSSMLSRMSDRHDVYFDNRGTDYKSSPFTSNRNQHQEFAPVTPSKLPVNNSYLNHTGSINPSQSSPGAGSGLWNLEMSAAEFREKLTAEKKRRRDVQQEPQLSMRQKHDLINGL